MSSCEKFPETIYVGLMNLKHVFDLSTDEHGRLQVAGNFGNVLHDVSRALKFRFELKLPKDGQAGRRHADGNWTGLIGMMQRGEIDLVPGLMVSEHRAEISDYRTVVQISNIAFTVKKYTQVTVNDAFSFLFDMPSCIALVIFFCLMTVLLARSSKKRSFLDMMIDLLGAILNQGFPHITNTCRVRMLVACCLLLSLVVCQFVSGTILSSLAVRSSHRMIKDFPDLLKAVIKGTHICMVQKDGVVMPVLRASGGLYKKLADVIEKSNWFYEDINYLYSMGTMDNVVIIQENKLLTYFEAHAAPGTFERSQDTLSTLLVAYAVRKEFPCKKEVDRVLSRVVHSGLLEHYSVQEAFKASLGAPQLPDQPLHQSLKLFDLLGFFKILLVGYIVSFFVLCGEIGLSQLKKRLNGGRLNRRKTIFHSRIRDSYIKPFLSKC